MRTTKNTHTQEKTSEREIRDVQEKIHRILDMIAIDGKLAPQVPFVVPQPFDRCPYVSMSDGRRITFYTHMDTIVRSRTVEEPNPIHRYHMKYWPHTENVLTLQNSQELYDPHINNFELLYSCRKALHCEMCDMRLRLIICITCARGYCFFCAFRKFFIL